MKRLIFFPLAVCIISCTSIEETETLSIADMSEITDDPNSSINARILSSDDPNLDPNWQWYTTDIQPMYWTSNDSIREITGIRTPFFTNGHPLSDAPTVDELDMYPQDGWMLVAKDFGSAEGAPIHPFFAIYNKYTGTLRYCMYNARQTPFNDYVARLTFRNSSDRKALFTASSDTRSFLDDFETTPYQTVLGMTTLTQGWVTADFSIVGYDPTISSNTVFNIEIIPIDNSQLAFSSNEFLQNDALRYLSPFLHSNSFYYSDASSFTAIKARNTTDLLKVIRDKRDAFNSIPLNFANLDMLLSSTSENFTSNLGPNIGIIRTYLGPSKPQASSFTPATINFNGGSYFDGVIEESNVINRVQIALKADHSNLEVYKPVQEIPWGVLNIVSKPTFPFVIENQYYVYDEFTGQDEYYEEGYWAVDTDDVEVILNPNIDISNISIEYAIPAIPGNEIPSSIDGEFYPSIQISDRFSVERNSNTVYSGSIPPTTGGFNLHVKVSFTIPNPRAYEKELVFLKTYQTDNQ